MKSKSLNLDQAASRASDLTRKSFAAEMKEREKQSRRAMANTDSAKHTVPSTVTPVPRTVLPALEEAQVTRPSLGEMPKSLRAPAVPDVSTPDVVSTDVRVTPDVVEVMNPPKLRPELIERAREYIGASSGIAPPVEHVVLEGVLRRYVNTHDIDFDNSDHHFRDAGGAAWIVSRPASVQCPTPALFSAAFAGIALLAGTGRLSRRVPKPSASVESKACRPPRLVIWKTRSPSTSLRPASCSASRFSRRYVRRLLDA